MMKRAIGTVMLIVAVSIPFGPATEAAKKPKKAAPGFRTERTYFICVDGMKLQNIPAAQGNYPDWGPAAPSASALDGAGCGHLENAAPSPINAIWEGTFSGNLRAMSLELYIIDVGSARLTNVFPVDFTVAVDGEEIFASGAVDMDVEYVNEMITSKMTFSLTGLPFGSEPGLGTTERTIRIEADANRDMQAFWVWETTEVPAGITFNPPTLEATVFPVAP